MAQFDHFEGKMVEELADQICEKLKQHRVLPAAFRRAASVNSPMEVKRLTDVLVGRDEEVQVLLETLEARKTVVVWGGPGEGKSAVAAEAACRLWESGGAPGGVVRADFAGASAVALHSGVQAELAVPDLLNEACMPAGA